MVRVRHRPLVQIATSRNHSQTLANPRFAGVFLCAGLFTCEALRGETAGCCTGTHKGVCAVLSRPQDWRSQSVTSSLAVLLGTVET